MEQQHQHISILMPVFNGMQFMHDSVGSVLSQTFPHWELLIGVNGYPPHSQAYHVAKVYEQVDKRIRVLDLPLCQGKPATLNELVTHHCSHAYVALLDVDDIWHHRKLELQVPFLDSYDVVGSRCIWFGDVEGIVPPIPVNDISDVDFTTVNPMINSSTIVRKKWCRWNDLVLEDYDLWLRLRKANHRFYNCPEILVKHRVHRQSAFNAQGNHRLVSSLLEMHSPYA